MSRLKHPSPALVVAILALVAAIAVPAFALTRQEKRVVRKISKAQANKQINTRATLAGEVHSPARLVLDDPTPGDAFNANAEVVAAGPFSVRALCTQNFAGGANERAIVGVLAPSGSSFAGSGTDGVDFNNESTDNLSVAGVISSGNQILGGHATVMAPNGQVFTVHATAEVNDPAGECVFGVTAIGP